MIGQSRNRLIFCWVLLALNVAFIWGNSMLPASASLALSNWVRQLLVGMSRNPRRIPAGSGIVRKLAHAVEFAGLGIWLRWLFGMLCKKRQGYLLLPLAVGVLCACADEVIQMFVPGRGPGVRDVLIDTGGVVLGILLCGLALCVFRALRARGKKKDPSRRDPAGRIK